MDLHDFLTEMAEYVPADFLNDKTPKTFILAVSGGKDSMLLLYYFYALWKTNQITYEPRVFHMHHGLRQAADEEMKTVFRSVCEMELPLNTVKKNVTKISRRMKLGLEDSGRKLRYRNLKRYAGKFPQPAAVTAHHADDYVETVFLHLIRGGGPSSLRTLPLHSSLEGLEIFRPFLFLERKTIDSLVKKYSIPFREDESNQTEVFLRNRIRKYVMPVLLKEGMSTSLFWKNFHEWGVEFSAKKNKKKKDKYYIVLDEIFLEKLNREMLKSVLDGSLLALDLPPLSKDVYLEFLRQSVSGSAGIETSKFYFWKSVCGPLWIINKSSPFLKKFESVKSEDGKTLIHYGNQSRKYLIPEHSEPVSREDGMKIRMKIGLKSVKKILQEENVPPVFRKFIPIVQSKETGLAERICLSFFDGMEDKVAGR